MTIKMKKEEILHVILYGIFVVIYLITLSFWGMGTTIGNLRYYALFLVSIVGLISIVHKFRKKKNFSDLHGRECIYILFTGIVFLVISFFKAKYSGYEFSYRTLVQISLFTMPALYVLELNNLLSAKTIINLMKFTLIILIIMYFTESTHTLEQFFVLDNWKKINISISTSFTESNLCAEAFLQLFFFFLYFDNAEINGKKVNLKLYLILSIIFTILSFKRLGILFLVIFPIITYFIDYRKKISKKWLLLIILFFTIVTPLYTKFMQGKLFPNVDVFNLTSGRDYILSLWEKHDYLSYGYGTSMLVIGRYLEMDLVQIYLEMGIVSLFLFCFSFFKVTKGQIYAIAIMLCAFLNMLTASSLPTSLSWVLMMTTIICISSDKLKQEKVTVNIKKKKKNSSQTSIKIEDIQDLISVIIPCYNVEKYLDKCVDSIVNQSYKNLEIILVDDGSTDNTNIMCDEWAKKDDRIRVVHKENGGLSSARNTGIDIAIGKYISFVDSDDFLELTAIEDLLVRLVKYNADISIGNRYQYYENGRKVEKYKDDDTEILMDNREGIIHLNTYKLYDMSACGKLYKKFLFNQIRFPEGKVCEDFYIMYQVFDTAQNIVYFSKPLYNYLQRAGSISKTNNKINYDFIDAAFEQMRYVEKKYPELKPIVRTAYASANLTIYNQNLLYGEKLDEKTFNNMKNIVKKNAKFVYTNKEISLSKKMQVFIFINFRFLYDYLYKIYKPI